MAAKGQGGESQLEASIAPRMAYINSYYESLSSDIYSILGPELGTVFEGIAAAAGTSINAVALPAFSFSCGMGSTAFSISPSAISSWDMRPNLWSATLAPTGANKSGAYHALMKAFHYAEMLNKHVAIFKSVLPEAESLLCCNVSELAQKIIIALCSLFDCPSSPCVSTQSTNALQ